AARRPPRPSAPDCSTPSAMRTEPSCELLQEANVVLEEDAEVRDAVLQHRDALDAHPEGEPLHAIGVVAVLLDEPEHVGVDHAGAEDLDPAGALAERIAGAVGQRAGAAAPEAGDVNLDARFGEREEVGFEASLALGSEGRSRELLHGAREIGER